MKYVKQMSHSLLLYHTLIAQRKEQAMQDIDLDSSEELNEFSSKLTYQPNEVFKLGDYEEITMRDVQSQKDCDTPLYNQVIKTLSIIQSKYPHLSLESVITMLRDKALTCKDKAKQHPQKRQILIQKCQLAAKSFVELGYGISRMRKQISKDQSKLEIVDAREYDEVLSKVFISTYKRLEEFVKENCKGQPFFPKIASLTTSSELKSLVEFMKHAREEMGLEDIRAFFKLLKNTYQNYDIVLSKKQACSLYTSIHYYINTKKRKPNKERHEWTQQMNSTLANLYVKHSDSLSTISSQFKAKFQCTAKLCTPENLMYHLRLILSTAIEKVRDHLKRQQILQQSYRFKPLVPITDPNDIFEDQQASEARVALCQFWLMKEFDLNLLANTILIVNEFVERKKSKAIAKEHETAKKLNSLKGSDYQFAGKRRTALRYIRKNKASEPII